MKKVLILAFDFPPYNSIGAQRPYSWYKYLHEFNWHPIVVTRHWDRAINSPIDYILDSINKETIEEKKDLGIVIRAPFYPNLRDKLLIKFGFDRFSIIRKVLTIFYKLGEFLFWPLDNRKTIYFAANSYLKDNKVDAIIATGEPFILFKYGYKLSEQHNIPLFLDYRDGWTTNTLRNESFIDRLLNQFLFSKLEQKYAAISKHVFTAAPVYKSQLSTIINQGKISVLFNGYFEENFGHLKPQKTEVFTISYAGLIYPFQPIETFLEGVELFLDRTKANIRLNFFGLNFYEEQVQRIEKFENLYKYFNITDRLPHSELPNHLIKSDLLLLLASPEEERLAAKIFEYIAYKRPVLLVKNDNGILESILKQTNSGLFCNNANEVAKAIERSYQEWQQKGEVSCHSKNIEQYSRKEQTRRLAELLNKIDK